MPTAKPNSNGGLANPLSWRRYVAVTRLEDPWLLKAVFHYSRQLQTWSKTWSQAGRKPAANLLKTVFFLHSICLARARTSEPAAVRGQVFDKKSRKLVKSVSQTRTNLSKTWLQT